MGLSFCDIPADLAAAQRQNKPAETSALSPLLPVWHDVVCCCCSRLKLTTETLLKRTKLQPPCRANSAQLCKGENPHLSVHVGALGDNFLLKPRSGQEAQPGLALAECFALFWSRLADQARGNVNAHVLSSLRAPGDNCLLARTGSLLGNQGIFPSLLWARVGISP